METLGGVIVSGAGPVGLMAALGFAGIMRSTLRSSDNLDEERSWDKRPLEAA
jgi:threonine dehydrogenase-like Zn-dependent dehydrogenase